jgi:hypothetical protein
VQEHFGSALKGEVADPNEGESKGAPVLGKNNLSYLPQHLIHAFYVLRHMRSRDSKMRLMYCLNFFRSVQKRMALDLREFGSRERVAGDTNHPYVPPTEGDKIAKQNAEPSLTEARMARVNTKKD